MRHSLRTHHRFPQDHVCIPTVGFGHRFFDLRLHIGKPGNHICIDAISTRQLLASSKPSRLATIFKMRLQLYILFLVGLFQLVLSQDNLHSSGNYLIRYCPAEKVSQLELLIPAFQTHLHKVVSDVTMGTRSNAYRTFFKSLAMIAPVHRVLSRMEEGDVVLNPGSGPPFERLRHPAILCFDRSIPLWEGVDGLCDGGAYAAVVPGRELVVLCDLFWNLPYEPSHEMQCPHVRRNRFFPNDHRIADNKFGVFVHEFAHVYLSNWDTDYAFSLMDAARRDTDRSLTNPSNFALYASSEFSALPPLSLVFYTHTSFTVVVADCEQYVDPKLFPRIDGST